MKQPCDEASILGGRSTSPCNAQSQRWILAATILGSSMAFIDSTVVNVALPSLQSSLNATVVDVQWVIEGSGLFLSALILAGGALGDSLGRRAMFLWGIGLFAAASVGCGFSPTILWLVAFRCVQGIGAAALIPGSLAIISASFDERSRGQAIGTWSGFTAITTALGPVLVGWLIEHASWHWVFFINVPLAAAVVAISLWHVPESRSLESRSLESGSAAARRVDWLGVLIATLCLGGLVVGFLEAAAWGWKNPVVVGSLAGGFVCLVLFVVVEKRVHEPMVPLALFSSRSFSGANLLTLLLYSAIGAFFFLFPLNLIQLQGYSATATGAAALPAILLMFLLSRKSGGLVARYGAKAPLVVGPMIVAVGFVVFALPAVGAHYWTTFFPAFVVLGLGLAVSVAPLTTVVMSSVEQDRAGTASGINNAVARVAGVLAVAILGLVMVAAFGGRLESLVARLNLSPEVVRELRDGAVKLGDLKVPASLDAGATDAVRGAIQASFVFAFRVVMLICAGLSVVSAGVAWAMIPGLQGRLGGAQPQKH
jgi:EmrB/QacA subfamily drug resistance transporter